MKIEQELLTNESTHLEFRVLRVTVSLAILKERTGEEAGPASKSKYTCRDIALQRIQKSFSIVKWSKILADDLPYLRFVSRRDAFLFEFQYSCVEPCKVRRDLL